MNQDRLAQNAALAACLQDRVRPVPLRKSQSDLSRNWRLLSGGRQLGNESPRARTGPVQIRVECYDAERAVVLGVVIVDRMPARQLWPWPRSYIVIRWFLIVRAIRPIVVGTFHATIERQIR